MDRQQGWIMDSYTADTYTVDLSTISSTGMNWDPYYGAIPPVTITSTLANTGPAWSFQDLNLTSPPSGKITLEGKDADIEINGRSLMQILDGLEQRLGMLKCREDLESEWTELKSLGDQYRALVKNIEEKTTMWETLKKMPPPEIS